MPANLPYPLQFDESQWNNKFSKFPDTALPWYAQLLNQDSGGLYGGTAPTDAMGQPIQSYTDANNAAQADYQQRLAAYNQQQAAPAAAAQGTQINNTGSGLDSALAGMGMTQFGQQMADKGISQRDIAGLLGLPGIQNIMGPAAAPAAATGPAMPTRPDMTQAYLTALQSPGHVTSQGANVPAAAAPSNQSNVLQAFLQNWNGGKGAGNYDNSPVLAALRGNV